MKAVSTADVASGVETCRLACGGHGYMTCSNLPATYGLVTAMCTYEGENTVLHLQTARYLVKAYQSFMEGKKMPPTLQYFDFALNEKMPNFTKSTPWIISALKKVAGRKIQLAAGHYENRIKQGLATEVAWNETSVELVSTSEMHCRAIVVETFYKVILTTIDNVSKPLREVLLQLVDLYAVYTALNCRGDLLRVRRRILYFY